MIARESLGKCLPGKRLGNFPGICLGNLLGILLGNICQGFVRENDSQGKPWEKVDSEENAWEIYLVAIAREDRDIEFPGKSLGKSLPGRSLGNTVCQGIPWEISQENTWEISQGFTWAIFFLGNFPGIYLGRIPRDLPGNRSFPVRSRKYAFPKKSLGNFPGIYLG